MGRLGVDTDEIVRILSRCRKAGARARLACEVAANSLLVEVDFAGSLALPQAGKRMLRNGDFSCPVLKHGPRSLTYVRVNGLKTRRQSESDKGEAESTDNAAAFTYLELRREVSVGAYLLRPER